jgi:hypothetical protein
MFGKLTFLPFRGPRIAFVHCWSGRFAFPFTLPVYFQGGTGWSRLMNTVLDAATVATTIVRGAGVMPPGLVPDTSRPT